MSRSARGAALLLVLWMLMLMAGLIAVFALGTRTEALQGSALRQQVAARLAAEAGIELASLRLVETDPAARWVPDGRPQRFTFDGFQVEVLVQDEAGKMDLNAADAGQLSALMGWLGVEPARAERLGGVIQDWRDNDSLLAVAGGAEDRDYAAAGLEYGAKDQPFTTLGELQQLLGMDLATYRLLVPHVTIYTGMPQPDPSLAQLPVLQAMGLSPAQAAELLALRQAWRPGLPLPQLPDGSTLAVNGSGTYSVASRATRPDGTLFEVHATLRIGAASGFGNLYAPLAWRTGDPY
ncbi:type II secretion system minor pseudopilin [Arenimonas alkanexedens]